MRNKQAILQEISDNATEINEIKDYKCLDSYVSDKRIVLLGESSHGVGDYFTEKIKLIKYLHEHHGFNLVVLENGFLESALSKERLQVEQPEQVIKQHFMDIYHNEEMMPLFTEAWAQNLILMGMDIQPSYREASSYYSNKIEKQLDCATFQMLHSVEEKFFEINDLLISPTIKEFKANMKLAKAKIPTVINDYKALLEFPQLFNQIEEPLFFERFLQNRVDWLETNLKGYFSSGVARAAFMYNNVEWLLDYYKGEKMIIWAHNFHIRKSQTKITKLLRVRNVGYLLNQSRAKDCFTIGLYAGSGKVASLLRNELDIQLENKHHLEKLCNEASNQSLFLPLTRGKLGSQKWVLLESSMRGNLPKRIAPKDHYDAIICLKDVRLPTYFFRGK